MERMLIGCFIFLEKKKWDVGGGGDAGKEEE
jgi:hypothetical protein